jgi:exodeoxyribonuclease VII small subunit
MKSATPQKSTATARREYNAKIKPCPGRTGAQFELQRIGAMAKRDDKPMSFEEAMGQLEKIVEQIASGKIGLEETMDRYEHGMELVKKCRNILERAEQRIQVLSETEGGMQVAALEQSGDGRVEQS